MEASDGTAGALPGIAAWRGRKGETRRPVFPGAALESGRRARGTSSVSQRSAQRANRRARRRQGSLGKFQRIARRRNLLCSLLRRLPRFFFRAIAPRHFAKRRRLRRVLFFFGFHFLWLRRRRGQILADLRARCIFRRQNLRVLQIFIGIDMMLGILLRGFALTRLASRFGDILGAQGSSPKRSEKQDGKRRRAAWAGNVPLFRFVR